MLNISNSLAKPRSPSAPVKVHEIIFVWLVVMLAWHYALAYLGRGIQNFIYLQWGGIALTMVILSKHFIRRENLTFPQLMGNGASKFSMMELVIAIIASLLLGLASWATLVLLSAKIDVDWAYLHWGLTTASVFQEVEWRPSWLVLDVISAVILVPITEEIVFRGFVLRRLREKYTLNIAIVISSFLFAIVHVDKDFLGAFLMGIALAILAVRSSSLYAPIIVHGAYNAMVTVLQRGFGVFMVVDKTRIDSIEYWLPELILMAFCVVGVAVYLRLGLRNVNAELSRSS